MKNKLDQFFKHKLQDRPFDFNESYWNEMEQLLPQKKKKRRGVIWLWFGLLFIGSMVTYWTMDGFSSGTTQSIPEAHTASPLTAKTNPSTKQVIASSLTQPTKNQIVTQNTNLKKTKYRQNTSTSNVRITPNESNTTAPFEEKEIIDQVSKQPSQMSLQFTNAAPKLIQTKNKTKSETKPNLKTNRPSKQKAIRHSISIASQLPMLELKPFAIDVNLNQAKILPKIIRRWQLGLVIEKSFRKNQPTWKAGCQVIYRVTPTLSIGSELKYVRQAGTFASSTFQVDSTFNFGYNRLSTKLQPISQHFVEVPLSVSFDWQKHSILSGIEIQKLLGVKGEVQTYNSDQLTPTTSRLKNTSKGWLSTKEFSGINTSLLLGYEYRFGKISVGLRSHYHIKRLSRNLLPMEGPKSKKAPTWSLNLSYTLSPKHKALKSDL